MIKKIIEFIKKYWKIIASTIISALVFVFGNIFISLSMKKAGLNLNNEYDKAQKKLKENKDGYAEKINSANFNDFNSNGTIKINRSRKD